MRSFGQHHSHFHWQPGDLHHLGGIREDYDNLTKDDLLGRHFAIRQDHPSNYPSLSPIHPDEIHNQMTHRGTYDPRDRGNSSMEEHYRKIGKLDELTKRREDYNRIPYESNHMMRAIDAHDDYKGDSRVFNHHLRNPANFKGDHIQINASNDQFQEKDHSPRVSRFHALDRITDHQTVKPMSLYRGFGRGVDLRKMAPGHEFVDHGYTGLSARRDMSLGYSEASWTHSHDPLLGTRPVAMVHIPPGTRGHLLDLTPYGGPTTGLHREHEFVLHRGTHFRVMGHSRSVAHQDGGFTTPMHVVHLQVTGQHPLPLTGRGDDE